MHIPTTVLIDGQAVFKSWYPAFLKDVLQWHIDANGDFLMNSPPLWFKCVIWGELIFQLPFFFVASVAFVKGWNSIRIPCMVYSSHVITTMIPILGVILFDDTHKEMNQNRGQLFFVYLPYLIIPAVMLATMVWHEHPFIEAKKKQG
eukprot:CAMPEP_0113934658 /NCGR_PEP_ID=MMETSP1339-20121228/1951_1 /TAXON_ID=94617 /ORGANISM="Fibrocapsa japonica" /LENGTH=146 /DNA_ID=CAMNT_0000936543 /DNA_START=147 /DNA_END=587 /DNA_ORIENTATION=- /assembly_acc=CAM_ASM_000762